MFASEETFLFLCCDLSLEEKESPSQFGNARTQNLDTRDSVPSQPRSLKRKKKKKETELVRVIGSFS